MQVAEAGIGQLSCKYDRDIPVIPPGTPTSLLPVSAAPLVNSSESARKVGQQQEYSQHGTRLKLFS